MRPELLFGRMAFFAMWLYAGLTPAHGAQFLTLTIDKYTISAEIAATPAQRAAGLSGRSTLAPDVGMLFVFEELSRPRFWMRDTAIPLTIAFLDEDGRIVEIRDMAPFSLRLHSPRQPLRYALEMRRGWFSKKRITSGARVVGLERLRLPDRRLAAPESP